MRHLLPNDFWVPPEKDRQIGRVPEVDGMIILFVLDQPTKATKTCLFIVPRLLGSLRLRCRGFIRVVLILYGD